MTSPLGSTGLGLALAISLITGSAAQDSHEGPFPHEHEGRGHRGGDSLFVSPCGRPYRGAPGEPYPVATWFSEADSDHDGFLERAEFRADAAAFFAMLDRNHDGVIDTDEVSFYEHNIVPEILRDRASPEAMSEARLFLAQFGGGGGMGGGGGGGRGGGRHKSRSQTTPSAPEKRQSEMTGAAPFGLLAEPEPVTAADTEFNGRITLAEFLAAADRRFDALDINGQGRIALQDLPPTAVQDGSTGRGA